MRDAFGGVFTMNLLLVFIFIYVAFTAVSFNYAKAFKVKNAVIDFVEQNELAELSENYMNDKLAQLDQITSKMSYNVTCSDIGATDGASGDVVGINTYCYKGIIISIIPEKAYTIYESDDRRESAKKITYKVTTGANWNLGALNKILALGGKSQNSESPIIGAFYINGEAEVIIKK